MSAKCYSDPKFSLNYRAERQLLLLTPIQGKDMPGYAKNAEPVVTNRQKPYEGDH